MTHLMRCLYCGLLQDEPQGVKECARCGGELKFETQLPGKQSYLQVQMELDQVAAPAGVNIERHLMVTIRTPKEVPPEEAAPTESGRPPMNFTAVMDVSGSMHGEKIQQAKSAVQQSVQHLRAGDIFSLVTFSHEIDVPFKPSQVDDGTYQAVSGALRKIQASGTTALCGGLETGIEKSLVHKQDSNLVLLLSDGQANVGVTDLELVGQRAYQARQSGDIVSCLGIGMDYNEALLAEIATQGGGRFYHVASAHQIPAYLAGELGEVAMLAARDVKIHLDLPEGATLIPISPAFQVQQANRQAVVSLGDIPCDSELEIPLRLALLGQAAGTRLSVEGKLTFRSPAGREIELAVNRVTLRFQAQGAFQLRDGIVLPVAERIFVQMKAVQVLGIARTRAHQPQEAKQQEQSVKASLHRYAELLGKERAEEEKRAIEAQFSSLAQSPAAAKQTVANAYRSVRGSKDFDK